MSASEQRTDDSSSQDIHSTKDQSCSSKNLLNGDFLIVNKDVDFLTFETGLREHTIATAAYRALVWARDRFESIYDNIEDPEAKMAVREHLYRHFIIILNDEIREQFSKR